VQNYVIFQYKIEKSKLLESIKVTPYLREPIIEDDGEKGYKVVTSMVEEKNTERVMRDLLDAHASNLKVLNIASTMIVGDAISTKLREPDRISPVPLALGPRVRYESPWI
jgi:ATP phosphoribosyltransferase-like protein